MDSNRYKSTAQWLYENVFREERIFSPAQTSTPLPSLLKAARSLEGGYPQNWQSRDSIFVKQGKLLAEYEDDFEFDRSVVRYFPTYQALSNEELRGYFSWRTRLRKGIWEKSSLSFAFLYIYELLNGIGTTSPEDGFAKLKDFQDHYGELDPRVLPYLQQWLLDFAVYYGLDPSLLSDHPKMLFDNQLWILEDIRNQPDEAVAKAAIALSPKWLERSRFYKAHPQETERVIARTLRRISDHFDRRCKNSMTAHYFGQYSLYPVRLFESAVFHFTDKQRTCAYTADPVRIYHCRNGLWSVQKYSCPESVSVKLGELLRTADSLMRELFGFGYPIQRPLDTKWILKILREEIQALLDEQKAAEAARITIDYSQLARIRRDAAITRDSLLVEEELEEEPEPEPAQPLPANAANETPLPDAEYRLLQCLLYSHDLSWVKAEGHILSVLVDSINETLYDTFADSVLTSDEPPEVIEDYLNELKEMVHP